MRTRNQEHFRVYVSINSLTRGIENKRTAQQVGWSAKVQRFAKKSSFQELSSPPSLKAHTGFPWVNGKHFIKILHFMA